MKKLKKEYQHLASIIASIMTAYGCSMESIVMLFDITGSMTKGARFASLKGYRSDKANQTELADHMIILGFSYANMLKADKETLLNVNVNDIDVNAFNYDSIDFNGKWTLESFKNEVRASLQNALYEINNPTQSNRVSNDEKINDILVWNRNTMRLSILGEGMSKTVTEVGEYKQVKSVPLTIAKKLIRLQSNLRAEKYRRFAIDNLNVVKLEGETIEIY